MNLLFVADPLESFKTYKDTHLRDDARGRAARPCAAGLRAAHLRWQRGGQVTAPVREIALTGVTRTTGSRVARQRARCALADVDAVLMRKDPPFDSEYFYATHLLEQAEREGARVFNKPARAARPSGEAGDPGVPAVHRADAGDARARPRSAPSTPSTATSSSSRSTAWAAWASSASAPTA